MLLQPRPIHYADGGYRLLSASDARELVQTAIRRHGLACHHMALGEYCDLGFHADCFIGDEWERKFGVGNLMHFGKGSTPAQSSLSGLYETVERASSYWDATAPSLRGSFSELTRRGLPVSDPLDFALPKPEHVTRSDMYLATITSTYDPDSSLDWVKVWSVADATETYLPVCMVHSIRHDDRTNNIYHNRPNGLSSGTCLEEAILGGLLELVERDACCLLAVHPLPVPRVDLDSIDLPGVRVFLELAAQAEITVTIKDCTTDIGIPAFCTFLHDPAPDAPRACSGAGCHFSREIALTRSIAEACLERAVNRWQLPRLKHARIETLPPQTRWEAAQYFGKVLGNGGWQTDYVHTSVSTRSFEDVPSTRFDDLRDAVEALLRVLDERGIERVYIADLTKYGIPTVRAFVPDLEFAPKALYEYRESDRGEDRRLRRAPLRMGYREGDDFTFLAGMGNDHLL